MSEHTSEPWTVAVYEGETTIESKFYTVASSVGNCDANLIAAAPDILAALRRLLQCPALNLDETEGETGEAIEQAIVAIAKAEGTS
jgi:hypothetical protein